jgi:hypothetical protein
MPKPFDIDSADTLALMAEINRVRNRIIKLDGKRANELKYYNNLRKKMQVLLATPKKPKTRSAIARIKTSITLTIAHAYTDRRDRMEAMKSALAKAERIAAKSGLADLPDEVLGHMDRRLDKYEWPKYSNRPLR